MSNVGGECSDETKLNDEVKKRKSLSSKIRSRVSSLTSGDYNLSDLVAVDHPSVSHNSGVQGRRQSVESPCLHSAEGEIEVGCSQAALDCSSSSLSSPIPSVVIADKTLPRNDVQQQPAEVISAPKNHHKTADLEWRTVKLSIEDARRRPHLLTSKSSTALQHRLVHDLSEMDRLLPNREFSLFFGTWNLAEKVPKHSSVEDWLLPERLGHLQLADIYVIAIQEAPAAFSTIWQLWDVRCQEAVGPSHVLLESLELGDQHVSVFVRRELFWFVSQPETCCVPLKMVNVKRAKGALAIMLNVFGCSVLCIAAHLHSRGSVAGRFESCDHILRNLKFSSVMEKQFSVDDIASKFDVVFFGGDLNFRLNCSRSVVEENLRLFPIDLEPLLTHDQLKVGMRHSSSLQRFCEAAISFPPTYKYNIGSSVFDSSAKKRVPSYTDRVLFRSKGNAIDCIVYDALKHIVDSDHKPLYAIFHVSINPVILYRPLSLGMFNREVYVKALRKRHAALPKKIESHICSIQ